MLMARSWRLSLGSLFLLLLFMTQAYGVDSARQEELWIFDVHSHSAKGLNLENVIGHMEASGIRKIVLFARRGGRDEEVLQLHAKYPERVVPTVGFQNPRWLKQEGGFLDEVEAKLRSGRFRWMGELLLKHYGVPELQALDYDISPATDLFRRVLDLSAHYSVPVTIHHEVEPGNIEIFRQALSHNSQALVVWAHWCGRATPEVARGLLRDFASLYCDLGASDKTRRYGREKNPLVTRGGDLQPEWKAVIEAFPDRFLAAIDAVDPSHYNRYQAWVAELRHALSGLSPEIARRVAFENAERLLARWKGAREKR